MITENSLRLLTENIIQENNDIADAKQKLLNKEIKEKIEGYGFEVVDFGADANFGSKERNKKGDKYSYNYIQLRPISRAVRRFPKAYEERLDINLKTKEVIRLVKTRGEYEEPRRFKDHLPAEIIKLCGQFKHSMQDNFRVAKETNKYTGKPTNVNRTDAFLQRKIDKQKASPRYQELLAKADEARKEAAKKCADLRKAGASAEEIKKAEEEFQNAIQRKQDLVGGFSFSNNHSYSEYQARQGLKRQLQKDKKIAILNRIQGLEGNEKGLNKKALDLYAKKGSLDWIGKKKEAEEALNQARKVSKKISQTSEKLKRAKQTKFDLDTIGEECIVEGSHHSKYPPAINYKYVNNYLIKARKAIKAGNIEEAEKWAWEANITMHEDEMQGPGVAADKNAYNIYHKQLSNIHSAILAAKKANKENN